MNSWAAASPCTTRCVTSPPPGPARRGARPERVPAAAVLRRYAGLAATVTGALAAGARLADGPVLRSRAREVLDALGVGLHATGPLRVPYTAAGTLIVANHISWLDGVALLAVEPVPLIAKREVAEWPVVGRLARRTGSSFIERDRLRELPAVVRELAATLRDGGSVAVFPQGTTWCTAPGGPFRRAVFQAAIDAEAPVRPVAVDFTLRGGPSTAASYVGDDPLAASLHRVAVSDGLAAHVRACPPLWPHGHDRRSLAAAAYASVRAAAGRGPRPGAGPGRGRLDRPSPHGR